ncbi:efflux RND transporter periplasmic adaptor subunit [Paracoccus aestuariivivens]|uniref:Efflux RND transporter periplasmic adaptor subunit n=1 Tax=Paracoccus aestuariivivens TaxID=1820333 RepID=A0A6L6J842_9RHOB|nr:efflux RND transporter periplasmic adaptor subunit [Paracoccus aestuariivivens]MTH77365.1 efflux RND transporter periplasmic adaptor subunit [Paracoccus aestuariivivens]
MSALKRGIALSVFLPLAAGLFPSLAAAQQPPGNAPPPTVTVVTLHSQDVTLTTTLPGRVTASAEAEVRPQVNGIVAERLFDEGRRVKVGDPLFRIDKTTYEAAVAQAEAAVAQARAQALNARSEADRVATLRDRRVASESTSESAIAARDAADAAVEVAEALLRTANIELDRTTIRAELDGEIGLAQTSQGALVTASQANPLAVIRTLDPVHVDVTQSAAEVIRWRREVATKAADQQPDRTVMLRLADGSDYTETGTLTAAEPYVNETTGVITLRLAFANPDHILLPGMYVQAVVQQAKAQNVILAPQEGVARDRRGQPIALVVNAENQVEQRELTILQDMGNNWVVSEGLNDGDRLIVEGVQRIGPGMPVNPEERQATAPEGAAAPAKAEEAAGSDAAPAQGDPKDKTPSDG